jgi:putative CocE/NonD family hydrolase
LVDNWIRGTVPDQSEESLATIYENEWFTGNSWWDVLEYAGKYDKILNPMAWWCGYYDIFTEGCIAGFEGAQYYGVDGVKGNNMITIDPLGHCQSAADYFQPNLVEGRTLLPVAQSLQLYGVRDVSRDFKDVTFYVMSSSDDAGNFWTTLDDFPQYREANFYLQDNGVLSTSPSSSDSATTYVHDPADPVPSKGGNNLEIPCGPLDQQEVEARADNIVFTTPVLEDDLVLSGPMTATLYVSSDAVDTDFMVKISDVLPSGESRLLMDNAFRMRWREMKSEPTYMEDGEVYEIEVSLWNTSYVFPAGNQLRVSIASSNYPRFSINPNNGRLLKDEDFTMNVTATNTVHHSDKYQSRITLPKVSRLQLPEFHLIEAFEKNFPELGSAKEVISKFGRMSEDLVERAMPKKNWREEFAIRANKMGGKWL